MPIPPNDSKEYRIFLDGYNQYRKSLYVSPSDTFGLDSKAATFFGFAETHFNDGMIYYVYSIKDDKVVWAKNFKDLGLKDTGLTKQEILASTHPSHRDIIAHLLHGFFTIIGKNPSYLEEISNKSVYIRIGRSLEQFDNKQYWGVIQSIYPFEFDANGKISMFGSTILIADKYKNQGLFINVVPNEKETIGSKYVVNQLIDEFEMFKRTTLIDLFKFTPKQREVLSLLIQGKNKSEVCIEMKIDMRGLNSHFGNMVGIINDFFGKNEQSQEKTFANVPDFVKFLKNV